MLFNKFKFGVAIFFLSVLSAVLAAQEPATVTESTPASSGNEVEEVLVVGEQPGPSMWRVYKGEHVLWILGTISPLPKNMQWHSKQVETVVANSQEFLLPPRVRMEVGFWSKMSLLPSLIGVKHNPDGKKLVDILPPEIYARWATLKEKYIGKDTDIEKNRPIFVATELFKKSIDKSDMAPDDSIRWAIENIVRVHNIKTTKPTLMHELKNARATVKKFKKSSVDDTECFARTIERLETDLGAMRVRANAWAKGDLETLRNLPYHNEREDCETAVLNSEIAQDLGMQNLKQVLKEQWLAAAELALANNESTFAMLPMAEIYKSDGYLAALAAKGYSIEHPE
ncbi:TraB/GumN family protein [Cellvibrio sp.]|uniref:TraB/GumN family protein n=1 Tax=Cellvibrio sp. TaxID=1965322 RepID=UPI0039648473